MKHHVNMNKGKSVPAAAFVAQENSSVQIHIKEEVVIKRRHISQNKDKR